MKFDEQTKLSMIRTRFSAERTLMSWIRTSFSMITFGFGLLKFFQYLHDNQLTSAQSASAHKLGVFLILLGIFSLIPACYEHLKVLMLLHATDKNHTRWSYALFVAILVGLIGIYALTHAIVLRL